MARINSKAKGNANERVACKFMEEWTGIEFQRVANSGGIHNMSPWLAGDIAPVLIEDLVDFKVIIETKHLKYLGCLDGTRRNSRIQKIFDQCVTDAARISPEHKSLCLLRQNRMTVGSYIVVVKENETNKTHPFFLRLGELLLFHSEEILHIPYTEIV